jgi:hypothetical protein
MFEFFEHYPFVWGGAISGINLDGSPWCGKSYLDYLKDVKVGDILVAGGTEYIDFVGEIMGKPTHIPNGINRKDDLFYKNYGIAPEEDAAVLNAFRDFQEDYDELEDMVYIKTRWFKQRKFPNNQPPGGFQRITDKNIDFISSLVDSYK